jgi:hypothetical protein
MEYELPARKKETQKKGYPPPLRNDLQFKMTRAMPLFR